MSDPVDFAPYIPRTAEQRQILDELAEVKANRQSRAVLLYGPGGTGKTLLVRHLSDVSTDQKVTWLDPIDVDDSQHWLLSNLERYVVSQLDPDGEYFSPFLKYVSGLPRRGLTPTSRETVLSHLNRIKSIFTECYERYIDESGNSVVITFDTVEAIRGMYLMRVLTRWIKALPGTLFILAGRSLPGAGEWRDPISTALAEPPQEMHVTMIELGAFDAEGCREYLAAIGKRSGRPEDETEKLVHLTQGSPLWLAFAVDHIAKLGMPTAADAALSEIRRDLPYHGAATAAGRDRIESFKSQLVAPYHATDFRHEAIKRLAVVRESVSQPIWQRLMADRRLPDDVADFTQAWANLRAMEWIRPRANRRYITLHDAVAEELAQRVISIHDHDGRWRLEQWRRAAGLYAEQAEELADQLAHKLPDVDSRLRALDDPEQDQGATWEARAHEAAVIRDVAELDSQRQELHQLRAAHLFYLLLSDFQAGAQQFVTLLRQARKEHEVLFEDLLAFQMQRFLPGDASENALSDTVAATIASFREWLSAEGQECYVDVGLEMGAYLIEREQLDAAFSLLSQLPASPDHKRRYRLQNLQGNACLRIPGQVRESGKHFQNALDEASQMPLPDKHRYMADAHKELGFYYRNTGHWKNADQAYQLALDAIWQVPVPESGDADLEQKASIYTNWAYVKGIGGKYDEGISLVESAIILRRRLGRRHEQAITNSVKGEVYRYHRQFKEAWEAYADAEQLFLEQNSWSWLGVIYQEQAICLYQSVAAGERLLDPRQDPREQAERLILQSVTVCKEVNARAHPSALNRAGRIFGDKDPDRGLDYLSEGAERAKGLSDGWFWIANLIEYAELCYHAWSATGQHGYRDRIPGTDAKLQEAAEAEHEFPELRGRWNILQGHLAMHDGLATGDADILETALENYRVGFPLITQGWVGSYGAATAIPREFDKFKALARKLPAQTRARWQQQLYLSWHTKEGALTQLLARLEELS